MPTYQSYCSCSAVSVRTCQCESLPLAQYLGPANLGDSMACAINTTSRFMYVSSVRTECLAIICAAASTCILTSHPLVQCLSSTALGDVERSSAIQTTGMGIPPKWHTMKHAKKAERRNTTAKIRLPATPPFPGSGCYYAADIPLTNEHRQS